MLCISIGHNSYSNGYGCVAIGDNTRAVGMWQVETNDTITLPPDITKERLEEVIRTMEEIREVYNATMAQGYAPDEFGKKARTAIFNAVTSLRSVMEQLSSQTVEVVTDTSTEVQKDKEEIEYSTGTTTSVSTYVGEETCPTTCSDVCSDTCTEVFICADNSFLSQSNDQQTSCSETLSCSCPSQRVEEVD